MFQPEGIPPILDDLEEWERPLVDLLETPGVGVLVLYLGEEFVGKAVIDLDPDRAVWLENVYVSKDHRRKGVARDLIQDLREVYGLPVRLFAYSRESERVWLNFGFIDKKDFLQYD